MGNWKIRVYIGFSGQFLNLRSFEELVVEGQGEIYGLKTPKGWIDFIGFQYEICEQRKTSGCLGYIGDEILLNCVGNVSIPMKNNQYFMEVSGRVFVLRGSCGKEHSISLMWRQHPNFCMIFFSLSP